MHGTLFASFAILPYLIPISASPINNDPSLDAWVRSPILRFSTFSDTKCSSSMSIQIHSPVTANVCHTFDTIEKSLTITSRSHNCLLYVFTDSNCKNGKYPNHGFTSPAPACHAVDRYQSYQVLCDTTSSTSGQLTGSPTTSVSTKSPTTSALPTIDVDTIDVSYSKPTSGYSHTPRAKDIKSFVKEDKREENVNCRGGCNYGRDVMETEESQDNSTLSIRDDEDTLPSNEIDSAFINSLSKRRVIPLSGVNCINPEDPKDKRAYHSFEIRQALDHATPYLAATATATSTATATPTHSAVSPGQKFYDPDLPHRKLYDPDLPHRKFYAPDLIHPRHRELAAKECGLPSPSSTHLKVYTVPLVGMEGLDRGENDEKTERVMFVYDPRSRKHQYCSTLTHRGVGNDFVSCVGKIKP